MTYLGRKSVRVQHEHGLPCLPHKLEPENPGSKWSDYTAALFVKQHCRGGGDDNGTHVWPLSHRPLRIEAVYSNRGT